MSPTPYRPVRALERGIALLLELNRAGRARPGALAKATGLDRTTCYRLLATLADLGLVARSASDDSYYLLRGIQRLADGFIETDRVMHVAARELGRMLPSVKWPSDFATFEQGAMITQESTHRFSPLSVNRAEIGRHRRLTSSALGRAVLAGSSPDERSEMLRLAAALPGAEPFGAADEAGLLEDFGRRGYAWSVGRSEPHISAIALPINGVGRVLGAVNIIFFRRALTPEEIATAHLSTLQACVEAIETACREG